MLRTLVCASAVVALATTAAAQFTVVVPNGMAAAEGSSSNAFPWGRTGIGLRHQCIYDSSHFTAQGVTFPILITGLKWRPNTNVALVASSYTAGCTVQLSTCPLDQAAVSSTMASNQGADLTTCYSGVVSWNAQPAVAGPTPFGIDVPFTTNFIYDPNLGDLNVECDLPIQTFTGSGPQLDVHAVSGQALASRVYISTGYPGTGVGTINTNHGVVIEVSYVPAAGLHPAFAAAPRSGPVNTQVQFTDLSYSSAPGGVLAWAWDFQNDGIVDSTVQNPTFVYAAEGSYTVKLEVVDAVHGVQNVVKTGYVVIDAVEASFTSLPVGGTTVQFTDTSTGSPTSWAWDFQNDGIVDSNLPNPSFTYPIAGAYDCKLTVSDAFSTDDVIVNLGVAVIPMPPFGSTYTNAAQTRGFWFQAPTRFSIVSALVPDETAHGTQNVAIYRLAGAPPGTAIAAAGLELLATGVPSSAPVPCAVSFDAGEFVGVLGACGDASIMHNSYGTGPFATTVLGAPTTLTRFITQTNLVTAAGLGPYSSSSGSIARVHLGVSNCTSVAYGAGTPSGAGPAAPKLKTGTLPFLGTTAQIVVENGDANAIGLLAIGIGRANLATPFGTVLVAQIGGTATIPGTPFLTVGNNTFSFAIPNTPALNGAGPFNWQNANVLFPNGQIALSNGLEWFLAL